VVMVVVVALQLATACDAVARSRQRREHTPAMSFNIRRSFSLLTSVPGI
jgi:hypothetical protein